MRAFVVVCYLLLNVREERRNLYIKIKTPNGIISTVAFFMYTARQKQEQEETSEFWRGREEIFRIHQKNNAASE